ncbi:CRISPR-associated RecB family exonuclease Cas4a [Candidatus Kuenenia stuttgartiensis]|uniref:CRISPR-associated RecB family exonuclease Cas4a n=2 Tax=Kuenenia stuttgartiensis TaxID=174633 RepID=A0A6G7GN05_KUEST|nr:CRISPR-associated RecB family exonuclease Cas4a [Candidatus Kuenenia stuttgartiensis]
MSRQMTADQDNSYIDIGRLIDDTSFEREKKKIYLADIGAMIDMVTKKDGTYFIAEIKKSSRTLNSGIFQLKYYLFLLKKKSIEIKGIIKIPKEKKSIEVELANEDIEMIECKLKELGDIVKEEKPPPAKWLGVCPKCGHFEFCWS